MNPSSCKSGWTCLIQYNNMKIIVVSAVNLVVGGTLTILKDCLSYLSELDKEEFKIYALVHDKSLVGIQGVEYIELPWPKKNWINRLWCEYVSMKRISEKLGPVYLWLSLHDTTPNVKAERRAVYCHNPFPFYKWKFREIYLCPKIVLFSLFSYFIYRFNIYKNDYVIMQQRWIREEFARIFGIDRKKMLVALPVKQDFSVEPEYVDVDRYTFFYASSANSHKNFEVLCEAADLLEKEVGKGVFNVIITVNGNENKYAGWLKSKWGNVDSIEFKGFMNKSQLYGHYNAADCFVFPSKVETWGLPVTEFAFTGKPMLVADTLYAHETAASSKRTAFFNPDDPEELKKKMKSLLDGDSSFLKEIPQVAIEAPVSRSWKEMFDYLLF